MGELCDRPSTHPRSRAVVLKREQVADQHGVRCLVRNSGSRQVARPWCAANMEDDTCRGAGALPVDLPDQLAVHEPRALALCAQVAGEQPAGRNVRLVGQPTDRTTDSGRLVCADVQRIAGGECWRHARHRRSAAADALALPFHSPGLTNGLVPMRPGVKPISRYGDRAGGLWARVHDVVDLDPLHMRLPLLHQCDMIRVQDVCRVVRLVIEGDQETHVVVGVDV